VKFDEKDDLATDKGRDIPGVTEGERRKIGGVV